VAALGLRRESEELLASKTCKLRFAAYVSLCQGMTSNEQRTTGETKMTIARKIREAFAGCSTTGRNDYFVSKGHGVNYFDDVLRKFALAFDETEFADYSGDAGRVQRTIRDECLRPVGYAILSWYRMPSGRYEFTGYIC
jgi:hypothetical protein